MSARPASPPDISRLLEQGIALYQSGQAEAAAAQLRQARERDPRNPQVLYHLGNALRIAGALDEAAQALKAAIELDPALADAWFSLAFLHFNRNDPAQAEATLQDLCRRHPDDPRLQHKSASLLAGFGRHAVAALLYERLVELQPERSVLRQQLGMQYQKLGRFADAAVQFRQAIALDPDNGPSYLLLANTQRAGEEDRPLQALFESGLARPGIGSDTRACLHFGLGKLHDDWGDHDQAFGHFRTANELRRAQAPFDRAAWQRTVDDIARVCRQLAFQPKSEAKQAPVAGFVVGMLRSGTTLVERLLTNGSTAEGLGETELLDTFIQRIEGYTGVPYPECLLRLSLQDIAAIAADYRRQISIGRSANLLLDKNPLNFMHVGLIALLMPEAPILHCRRDALDVCLSVYFQDFAHARNGYANDLGDIAAFYAGYLQLMALWDELLPGRLIEVEYEKLVADPEAETRRLYRALGLAWTPDAIRPQDNPATISTASVWQARQPIYSHAVGRWRHYEKHLEPLRAALQRMQPSQR